VRSTVARNILIWRGYPTGSQLAMRET